MATESRNESPLIVDLTSRTITVPDELKYIGVETDNNSEKVWFKVPRYFDEPDVQGNGDLSQKIAQVHFLNAGGSFGVYTITESQTNNDGTISLAWLIEKDVTMFAGEVQFQLVFTYFDEERNNVYKLSTTPAKLLVRAGIDNSNLSISTESKTYEQLLELIYDGYETLKAVDIETLRNLSASPKGVVSSLLASDYENLESGLYLYMPDDDNDEYYGYVVYWDGFTVSDPIVKYLTTTFSAGCIQTTHLASEAVTSEKLANSSVVSNKISDGAVTESKLGDGAVTNTKLSDSAITLDKLEYATKQCYDDNSITFGVNDVVDAYQYFENENIRIGMTDDGHIIRKHIIEHTITENEITLGYIDGLFGDLTVVINKVLSVDLYMVSSDGVLVPLYFQRTQTGSLQEGRVYLNGIVCESDGVYRIKPESNETWILRGNIVFTSNKPTDIILM